MPTKRQQRDIFAQKKNSRLFLLFNSTEYLIFYRPLSAHYGSSRISKFFGYINSIPATAHKSHYFQFIVRESAMLNKFVPLIAKESHISFLDLSQSSSIAVCVEEALRVHNIPPTTPNIEATQQSNTNNKAIQSRRFSFASSPDKVHSSDLFLSAPQPLQILPIRYPLFKKHFKHFRSQRADCSCCRCPQ